MTDEKVPESSKKIICQICDYITCRKSQYARHVLTRKHTEMAKYLHNTDEFSTKTATKIYKCMCGKEYNHRQSLFSHKKKCTAINTTICVIEEQKDLPDDAINNSSLILELIKQNDEFKYLLLEQNNKLMDMCENGVAVQNNTNINSHNKTFNLNMFLNEDCKDAMNLTDFVDSLQFQLSDLEKVGELGYVTGLSNFIIRNLKALDIHKRPVHCSDAKRETIFIKEADKWEKENDENEKLHKAIKTIANKNIRLIPKWREKYPECAHSDSCKSDQYNNIIIHSLDTNKNSNPKIIKNIAKEVKIEKGG